MMTSGGVGVLLASAGCGWALVAAVVVLLTPRGSAFGWWLAGAAWRLAVCMVAVGAACLLWQLALDAYRAARWRAFWRRRRARLRTVTQVVG